jgi:hypothetical protein
MPSGFILGPETRGGTAGTHAAFFRLNLARAFSKNFFGLTIPLPIQPEFGEKSSSCVFDGRI